MTEPAEAWTRACLALDLLGIDPAGLGGLRLRARAGPVRDRFLAAVPAALAPRPCRRLHPGISDEALFGDVDHLASLAAGALIRTHGLIGAEPLALILPMAERAEAGLAARLATMVEAGHCLLALDEGDGDDTALAPALAERLALHIDLDGLPQGDCPAIDAPDLHAARALLPRVRTDTAALRALTELAAQLGIGSLRTPWLALRAARAAAARAGRDVIAEADLLIAAALVLGPRAVAVPPLDAPEEPPPAEENTAEDDSPQLLRTVRRVTSCWRPRRRCCPRICWSGWPAERSPAPAAAAAARGGAATGGDGHWRRARGGWTQARASTSSRRCGRRRPGNRCAGAPGRSGSSTSPATISGSAASRSTATGC